MEKIRKSSLMKISEVMEDLGICRSTVYNLKKRKHIVFVKVGGATRIKRSSVEGYIERNTLEAKRYGS